jgi:histidinol-phosphatase (PHP family)
MFKSTFHSHSRFDDGREELEDYIKEAINRGFQVFGFSAHAPVLFDSIWNMRQESFDEYMATTKALKEKYKDVIEIYTGLETDFYPQCIDFRAVPGIDYTIGSVHFLKHEESGEFLSVDGSPEDFEYSLHKGFNGDIQAFGRAYYGELRKMLCTMPPSILGHMDVFRKNNKGNKYFHEDDAWYRAEVIKTLEIIKQSQVIIEVNTGGISRGYVTEPYPSRWILEACHDMGIPVMINSDTHHPETIDFYYPEACALLKSIGFRHQRVLFGDEWRDIDL